MCRLKPMTDAKTTSDTKKTQSPDHHNTGCAHTTGLPLLSAMSPEHLEEAWTTGLRTKGRRVTKQRLAVLHAVQEHPHSTADTIVQAVRERIPAITVQSVYVILADLTDIDLLRKFEPPGTPPSTKPERATTTTTPSAYAAARSKTWTARLAPHPA